MDDAGRTKKVTDHKGREIAYEWNRNGEREAVIYPDGRKVSYEYDEFSRLSHLADGDREIRYQYDKEGHLSEKNYPDGIISSYSYNPMGLLSGFVHQKNEDMLEQYAFEYDKIGNKTGIRKTRKADSSSIPRDVGKKLQEESGYYSYQYDSLNRLTQVSKNRETLRRYEYDAFGNRIRQETGTTRERYHYNVANQLIRSEGIFPEASYQYDLRGNLTAVLHGKEMVNQYVYDETNRLSQAINAKGEAAQYQYDGLGNRVGRQEFFSDEKSAFHLGKIQPETDLFENPAREVDYLLDRTKSYHNLLEKREITEDGLNIQTYTWDGNVAFMTEGEMAHIYLQDELGSTVRLVEMGENEQTVYGYDEFGQDLYGTQGEMQPFGYTGYRKDRIANTYFAQAREYCPQLGSFLQKDVITASIGLPKSLNYYMYCLNNPIKFLDLTGASPTPAENTTKNGNITEDELRKQLKENYKNDIGQKWRRVYSPDRAIDIILDYDDIITSSANQFGINKSYIQSVLFREIYCIAYEDAAADIGASLTFTYFAELDAYDRATLAGKALLGHPVPPLEPLYREDSSTGYGQIMSATAMEAYNLALSRGLIEGTPYDVNNMLDRMNMWNKLNNDKEFNVHMVGMVLWYEKERLGYTGQCELTQEQGAQVIGKYNGNSAYGHLVYKYVDIFNQYNV